MSRDRTQKSYNAKPGEVKQEWHLIDAKGKVLGRLAQEIATLLMGKHRPQFTPNTDTGDYVVVLNAGMIDVTGNKRRGKMYQHFTGYPGGRNLEPFDKLNARKPGEPLMRAVKRMLPKNNLGRKMLVRLKLYKGTEHPHVAQQPKVYTPRGR